MHNIQSKKRANASLLYGNRSGLIFSPSSERPQCSVKRGDCLSKASSSPFSETKEESRRKNAALILYQDKRKVHLNTNVCITF